MTIWPEKEVADIAERQAFRRPIHGTRPRLEHVDPAALASHLHDLGNNFRGHVAGTRLVRQVTDSNDGRRLMTTAGVGT